MPRLHVAWGSSHRWDFCIQFIEFVKIVTPCSTGFGLHAGPCWDSETEKKLLIIVMTDTLIIILLEQRMCGSMSIAFDVRKSGPIFPPLVGVTAGWQTKYGRILKFLKFCTDYKLFKFLLCLISLQYYYSVFSGKAYSI